MPVVFAFVIPAITMRLISEELNIGSDEILLTMPVTYGDVIIGKFLASVALIMVMLIPTLAYPLTVSFIGQLDWGPVVGGYVGAVFMGAAFSAVGLFASALTRNQIIAFIIGLAICFTLTLIDKMLFFLPQSLLGVLSYLGADFNFQNIAKGIIDSRDILYFMSICFVGLFGAHLALNQKY
jgi:ABC-2 type transport system permease protein